MLIVEWLVALGSGVLSLRHPQGLADVVRSLYLGTAKLSPLFSSFPPVRKRPCLCCKQNEAASIQGQEERVIA